MTPVIDKIKATIQAIGNREQFDYIFDMAAGNILHASSRQPDLTSLV